MDSMRKIVLSPYKIGCWAALKGPYSCRITPIWLKASCDQFCSHGGVQIIMNSLKADGDHNDELNILLSFAPSAAAVWHCY